MMCQQTTVHWQLHGDWFLCTGRSEKSYVIVGMYTEDHLLLPLTPAKTVYYIQGKALKTIEEFSITHIFFKVQEIVFNFF